MEFYLQKELNMLRKFFRILFIGTFILSAIGYTFSTSAEAAQPPGHCAPGGAMGKVEFEGEGPYSVSSPSGTIVTEIWIKAGNPCYHFTADANTGCYDIVGIGTNTVTVTKVDNGPDCKDVSHIEFNWETPPTATALPSPTPEDTPEPSPTPEDTPGPSPTPEDTPEPSPTPEDTPGPSPTPEDTPEPSPTPEDTPGPSPTPEDTPEPSPTPEDTPGPSPTPEDTPEPSPTPEDTPGPSPTPEDTPEPSPTAPPVDDGTKPIGGAPGAPPIFPTLFLMGGLMSISGFLTTFAGRRK
jgi:hypothetical protein